MSEAGDGLDTRIVAAGRRPEWSLPLVSPGVHRASTILFDSCAELEDAGLGGHGIYQYGRNGTPTQWSLAEALTELEPGSAGTRLFPSGVAAVSVALLSVLKPGDELLMVDSTYGPTRAFCDNMLKSLGIATTYYDPLVGAGIEALVTPATRAIFLESPGSLSMEVQDLPAIRAVAEARGLVTLLDNTWATPLLFPAIAAGIDLAILACTKYIGGHSDVMLGSVTATAARLPALERASRGLGQTVSPDDAWLCARGLRTLGVRLARHQENGLKVAHWLKAHPKVARVRHPALPDCPGHECFVRDFRGASGLFSFELRGGEPADRACLIDGLRHFGIGYSWGGFESLALPVDPLKGRTASRPAQAGPMVRLHIGLEDPDDLIADLDRALADYPAA